MLETQQASSNFVTPGLTTAKFGNSKKKWQYYNIFSKIEVSILKIQIYKHWDVWYTKCQFNRKQVMYLLQKEDS